MLCWGLWKKIWGDSGTQRNGRQGSRQHGVDVFGRLPNGSGWGGVQCKGKDNFSNQSLSKREISNEVKKAKSFKPKLREFTIATTATRNAEIQEYVRHERDRLEAENWFCLVVCAWDDIQELLYEHEPDIARQIYPTIFGGQFAGLVKLLIECVSTVGDISAEAKSAQDYKADTDAVVNQAFAVDSSKDNSQLRVGESGGTPSTSAIRAIDVASALSTISRIEEKFSLETDKRGLTSASTKLADAVIQALGGRAND